MRHYSSTDALTDGLLLTSQPQPKSANDEFELRIEEPSMDLCLEVIPQAVFQVQVVSADPVRPIAVPGAVVQRVEVCRPRPAQDVVPHPKPTRTRRSAQVRRSSSRAANPGPAAPITADLPSVKAQKADRLFHEAIRALKVNDYEAAHRHLILAVSFAPGNPRYDMICKKVRRYLQSKAD